MKRGLNNDIINQILPCPFGRADMLDARKDAMQEIKRFFRKIKRKLRRGFYKLRDVWTDFLYRLGIKKEDRTKKAERDFESIVLKSVVFPTWRGPIKTRTFPLPIFEAKSASKSLFIPLIS